MWSTVSGKIIGQQADHQDVNSTSGYKKRKDIAGKLGNSLIKSVFSRAQKEQVDLEELKKLQDDANVIN